MSTPVPDPNRRPRLVRTRRGRLIGGVCSGLGAHFGVDPILFRIAFVGLAIFSGIGIALYLVLLLLVAEEGAAHAPIHLSRSSWRSVLGVIAIVTAVGIALSAIGHGAHRGVWGFGVGLGSLALVGVLAMFLWQWLRASAATGADGHASADRRLLRCAAFVTAVLAWMALLAAAGAWLAGIDLQLAAWAVVAVGGLLVLGAYMGWARWLVLPGVAFALAAATIAAAHVDLHGGMGERTYRPQTLGEVRGGYELGAGRLEIDLRNVAFPAGTTRLHLRLGVGEAVVLVPKNVCVATSASIGGGYVGALENRSGGLDIDWSERPVPPLGTPRLLVDGSVGLGALLVADHPVEHDWRGWGGWGEGGWFASHSHRMALGTNEACLPATGVSR
jgi:phage shock protein PspC (stress-responsive transcriptional regulator)